MAALNDRRRSDGSNGGGGDSVPREPIALAKIALRCVYTRVSQVAGCCDSRSRVHACRSPLTVRSRRRRRLRLRLRLRLGLRAKQREAPIGRSCIATSVTLSLRVSPSLTRRLTRLFFFFFFSLYLFWSLTSRQVSSRPEGLSLSPAIAREKIVSPTISRTKTGRRGNVLLLYGASRASSAIPECCYITACARAPLSRRRARFRSAQREYSALDIRVGNICISSRGDAANSREFRDEAPMRGNARFSRPFSPRLARSPFRARN